MRAPTPARRPSLWDRFAATAKSFPGSPAVRDPHRTYTYAEAYRGCVSAAGALRAGGVTPGDTVLVCTEHTVDGVIASLAVRAAGATPVPVEPDSPRARAERIAAISGARVALVDAPGHATIDTPGISARGISALRIEQAAAPDPPGGAESPGTMDSPSAADRPPGCPDGSLPGRADLAYILFTSGSTGTPKGVEVTEANMRALLDGAPDWDTCTATDVWACFHAFTFDISMWEIWRPLTLGAQLVVLPRAAQVDGELAYSLVRDQGVTVLCQTPTAARLFADQVSRRGLPAALRRLLLAGERLDFAALRPFAPAVASGRLQVWNLYGPTEATIYSTGYQVSAGDIERERRSLIGRALPHVRVAVHDPGPDGVGELWITGPGVAAGYRADPELTRRRFVADRAGRRAYRTGDLVRDRGDGVLEFIGRVGGFVKVRGYRIEPGEIVSALSAHPAVQEAAVVVTDVFGWGATVVGAVVPRPGVTVTELALRRHAAALLPGYMCPGRILFLDALPRLPSAKLDQLTLQASVEARLATGDGAR